MFGSFGILFKYGWRNARFSTNVIRFWSRYSAGNFDRSKARNLFKDSRINIDCYYPLCQTEYNSKCFQLIARYTLVPAKHFPLLKNSSTSGNLGPQGKRYLHWSASPACTCEVHFIWLDRSATCTCWEVRRAIRAPLPGVMSTCHFDLLTPVLISCDGVSSPAWYSPAAAMYSTYRWRVSGREEVTEKS